MIDGAYRILLADNDEPFRNEVASMLRNANYRCDCAHNADQATSMLAAESYDAFILDAEMPGNSRLELVHAMSETACGLPVILVTSHPTIETAVNAIHLPVEAYLVKPIRFEQMAKHLTRAVSRRRLYRTVTNVRDRMARWNDAVEKLQMLLLEPLNGSAAAMIGPMLASTFENIVASAVEFRRIINILNYDEQSEQRPDSSETKEMVEKMNLIQAALQETVFVLEESKHAFKSKRLGELRRQLQALLEILKRD